MKKLIAMAAIAAAAFAFAGEHDTPQVSGDYAQLAAGEAVYAGNIAAVGTNGCAYAVNTAAISGTLTVCGVFLHSARTPAAMKDKPIDGDVPEEFRQIALNCGVDPEIFKK